jgi:hypothetical protein
VGAVIAGALWIVVFSASTYARNLVLFHNPVWPDLRVQVPSVGIDWPGNYPFGAPTSEGDHLSNNVPWNVFFQELFAAPGKVTERNQKYIHMYGLGVIWVFFPAVLFSLLKLVGRVPAMVRWATTRVRAEWLQASWLAVTALVTIATSTNRSTPRYHLPTLALWIPVVAWAVGRNRALQQALAFSTAFGSLVIVAWEAPAWRAFPGPATMLSLWRVPATMREITPELGATVLRDTGLARERELTANTTVVSDDFVFPAVLWNNDYSNRVLYVRPGEDLARAADRVGATWIYAADDRTAGQLRRNERWSEVGALYVERWGTAFRRRR